MHLKSYISKFDFFIFCVQISEQIGMSSSCGKDPLSRAIYMICKAGLINSEANKEECSEILRVFLYDSLSICAKLLRIFSSLQMGN